MFPGRLTQKFSEETAGATDGGVVLFGGVRLPVFIGVLVCVLILRGAGVFFGLQLCRKACVILDSVGRGTLGASTGRINFLIPRSSRRISA